MSAELIPEQEAPAEPRSGFGRRQFLGATAGGLAVAFVLKGTSRVEAALAASGATATAAATPSGTAVNGWVLVGTDGTVTVSFGGAEMGQGISTGLAQGVAEELMVDWSAVRIQAAPASQSYITGGSSAIRNQLQAMRVAGAQAREMLIAAAAQRWGVAPSTCKAVNGTVVCGSLSATYADLASAAAAQPVPASPPLVDPSAFRILGKPVPRADIPAKVNGSAVYGIDVMVPGMVFAVVRNCPTIGGTVSSTPAVPPGATAVVNLGNAVAVVATNTWQAMQAASQLQVSWKSPANASAMTSSTILSQAQTLLASGTPVNAETVGDANAALAGAATVVDQTYTLPYLAHACMEVLTCTVQITASGCEVWAPTQAPSWVANTAAGILGIAAAQVTVHATLLGGGLGRKIEQDYVSQAVKTAKAIGKPVKLMWPREEDFGHDQYRPMALTRIRAGLDASGNVVGWYNRSVSPSILGQRGWIGSTALDSQAVEGGIHLPYAMGARLVEWVRHPAPVPVGFWRSVGNSINAFAVESMIDELAAAAGVDPLAFRQHLLANDQRTLNVLNAAATLGGWSTPLPTGRARGIALCASFGSIVAEMVEISQPVAGSLTVHKVAVAVDCGTAVNPNQVEAQMQGGVVHGLSAALWGQVTFNTGRASARNFSNYRVLRLSEMPKVSVQVIQSGAATGGIGEVAVPPIAPALANAYFRLTGTRQRSLPFFPGATMGGY